MLSFQTVRRTGFRKLILILLRNKVIKSPRRKARALGYHVVQSERVCLPSQTHNSRYNAEYQFLILIK
nr:MAG TPA: hypothetical protein [Caudoviricetes sp.]